MERPSLGADELVVEVRATHSGAGFSGIVVACGSAVAGTDVGEEVFGLLPSGHQPGEVVVCRGRSLAPKPAALSHSEAALLASAGTVALRAARLAGSESRQRVMITGAGDETGALVLQIARARGGHVTGVCRERDVPLVWDIGADEAHAPDRVPDGSQRFAAVIDTDDSVTPEAAAALLDTDGRLISIRGGAVHMASASGVSVAVHQAGVGDDVDLRELAVLVERHGVFPVPRR